jgi:hypothetical protein
VDLTPLGGHRDLPTAFSRPPGYLWTTATSRAEGRAVSGVSDLKSTSASQHPRPPCHTYPMGIAVTIVEQDFCRCLLAMSLTLVDDCLCRA